MSLYNVYKTVISMLSKRGYESESEILTEEKINKMSKEQMTLIASKDSEKIIVFFSEEEKLGVKPVRNYYEKMISLDINNAILVVKENITSFAKGEILSFSRLEEPVFIEIFLEKELMFDITEHELQPKFRLLQEKERQEFLNKMCIKETQIAKILTTDPIVKFYNFKEKDILEITGISETAGIYKNYRIVS
jgi:DNA-directed RNA polymerase I, II, and III subunit RPABC1